MSTIEKIDSRSNDSYNFEVTTNNNLNNVTKNGGTTENVNYEEELNRKVYVVGSWANGEKFSTIWAISQDSGVSVEDIMAANPWIAENKGIYHPGDKIIVPINSSDVVSENDNITEVVDILDDNVKEDIVEEIDLDEDISIAGLDLTKYTNEPLNGDFEVTVGNKTYLSMTEEETLILAGVIYGEAASGETPYDDMLAVGSVICNREAYPRADTGAKWNGYDKGLVAVVTAPGQFAAYKGANYNQFMENYKNGVMTPRMETCLEVVEDLKNGVRNNNYQAFRSSGSTSYSDIRIVEGGNRYKVLSDLGSNPSVNGTVVSNDKVEVVEEILDIDEPILNVYGPDDVVKIFNDGVCNIIEYGDGRIEKKSLYGEDSAVKYPNGRVEGKYQLFGIEKSYYSDNGILIQEYKDGSKYAEAEDGKNAFLDKDGYFTGYYQLVGISSNTLIQPDEDFFQNKVMDDEMKKKIIQAAMTYDNITPRRIEIISKALDHAGIIKYNYGSKRISSGYLDCSGFVCEMLEIDHVGTSTMKDYEEINFVKAVPGDLIVKEAVGDKAGHVEMYLGDSVDGKPLFIDCSSSRSGVSCKEIDLSVLQNNGYKWVSVNEVIN